MITVKNHPDKLVNVVFPGGQQRIRNCTHSAIPSERRPVGNLLKADIAKATARVKRTMLERESIALSYRAYRFKQNVFGGLFLMLWIIAAIYFYIISRW